jgi:RimJ/RimL family protein N-acetyltransferase
MSLARAAKPSGQPAYIDTPHLYMRTLTLADASERWAAWFDQGDVQQGLNLPANARSKADIEAYIRKFDLHSNLLLGIFDKADDLLLGILTTYIDWNARRFVANTVVGEASRRGKGVMLEVSPPFRTYFFETLGLETMVATALATNKAIIGYLEKTGWTLEQTLKDHVKLHADGSMADLLVYSISRTTWNAWKLANPDVLKAISVAAAPR